MKRGYKKNNVAQVLEVGNTWATLSTLGGTDDLNVWAIKCKRRPTANSLIKSVHTK